MQTGKLGYSDLHLSVIGLGTHAIGGGDNPIGWGPQEDADSIATIHRALDLGINWIDTAPVYGLGHSEEIVGRAVKGRRDHVILATKTGIIWEKENGKITFPRSQKAASVRRQVEDSLRRLDVEVIDLLQIHWPPVPDDDIEECWSAIVALIKEGKVRYGGVSNFSVAQMRRLQSIHPIASNQPPYNMLNRDIEDETLPFCAENDIGVISYTPMERGLLTGKVTRKRIADFPEDDLRKRQPPFQEPQLSANFEVVTKLEPIAARKGITLAQLAVAWVLQRPEITSAIVGARQASQIQENVIAADVQLCEEDLRAIQEILEERRKTLGFG